MSRDISLHKTSLCGYRESNEDVEKYNMNLSRNGKKIVSSCSLGDFFVICDGHGGDAVAKYVVNELEKYIMHKKNITFPLSNNYVVKLYDYIQKKLCDHPDKIAQNCGCTALVVIRYINCNNNKCIQVINIGDSRAVMSRNGLALPLCKDHKPFWPDEKKRIDNVNKQYGTDSKIYFDAGDWRIGDLSVSRSFGDLDNTPYVTHTPDIYYYEITNDDEFIIMACDGVWDVLTSEEAVNFVRDHLYDNHTDFYGLPNPSNPSHHNLARKLAEYAIFKGSLDNVSVMIIIFS